MMGNDDDGDGRGEPRSDGRDRRYLRLVRARRRQPNVCLGTDRTAVAVAGESVGLGVLPSAGVVRLAAVPKASNLWTAPNLLMQKFPAPAFTVTTRIDVTELGDGERAGLVVFGTDYAWVGIERTGGTSRMVMRARKDAPNGGVETVLAEEPFAGTSATLVLTVTAGAQCRFNIGPTFAARPGRWVGAKVGLFAAAPLRSARTGSITVRSFVIR